MAVDKALLRSSSAAPILRVYDWEGDWISFGYFQKYAEIAAMSSEAELVRRPTGGGLVDHRIDWTYTLFVPRSEELGRAKATASYGAIHDALRRALGELGVRAALANGALGGQIGACFAGGGHAHLDVLVNGRKLAGAAQRKARQGLLHQGSVLSQGLDFPSIELFDALADQLAERVEPYSPDRQLQEEIESLKQDRYLSDDWLRKR